MFRNKSVIITGGASGKDADTYIIPEIERLGLTPKYLVSSHTHSDHYGGMGRLIENYTNAKPIAIADDTARHGDMLFNMLKILNLKGHTDDSMGILDTEKNILFSFDSLQLRGISRYRNGVSDIAEYKKTIEYLESLNLNEIIASHEYDPYGYRAVGEHQVMNYLNECKNSLARN